MSKNDSLANLLGTLYRLGIIRKIDSFTSIIGDDAQLTIMEIHYE